MPRHVNITSFKKGQIPWNKGLKVQSNTGRTWFKKGHKTWNKNKPYLAIRGENHYRWRGGFWINEAGYKIIEVKRLGEKYRVREHDLVMEKFLGRKLNRSEEIHHIDGNKLNNDISNLLLINKSEHTKLHQHLKLEVMPYSHL